MARKNYSEGKDASANNDGRNDRCDRRPNNSFNTNESP
jgi:hypothetical protein